MFRNHLHPVVLFSSLVLSLGVFCLAISGQLFYDRMWRYRYDADPYSLADWPSDELTAFALLLGIGAFLLTGALGLIFRKNWARYLMQFGFILAALAWLFFLTSVNSGFRQVPILFTGITAAVLGCVIGALLFLNNAEWVLPYFQRNIMVEAKSEILDQDMLPPQKRP